MPKKIKLVWLLYPSYISVILFCLAAIGGYAVYSVDKLVIEQTKSDLEARARLAVDIFQDVLSRPTEAGELQEKCLKAGIEADARITLIRADGAVLCDSEESPEKMENHLDRPEVAAALKRGAGYSSRYSPTRKINLMYVAMSAQSSGALKGVVRVSMPVRTLEKTLDELLYKIALGGLVVALIAALTAWFISKRIAKPVEKLISAAQSIAGGEFNAPLPKTSVEELSQLSGAINAMANQLYERIRSATEQREELEAIMSSMVECVILLSREGRVIRMNEAAERLFNVKPGSAADKNILEISRNREFESFVEKCLADGPSVESEIRIASDAERTLNAYGVGILNGAGEKARALIVLHDITKLKRLETVRKDFVANVSHELKTPITSIKGFVETLKETGKENPEDVERFLGIISKHADRLNAIIDDLLSLSRIEQAESAEHIKLEKEKLLHIIESAALLCRRKAEEKNIELAAECDPSLTAVVNPALLEQAIVNLVDNAVKYSAAGGTVKIRGFEDGSEIVVEVKDSGCGIPKDDLPRIFERFYRVDKARSRSLGGTGLGLSIVKHIANLHRGQVTVESEVGKGSVFKLKIPN